MRKTLLLGLGLAMAIGCGPKLDQDKRLTEGNSSDALANGENKESNILENSSFDGDRAWELNTGENADALFLVSDKNQAQIKIDSAGNKVWEVELSQNTRLEQGKAYQFSFNASSQKVRDISVAVLDAGSKQPIIWTKSFTLNSKFQNYAGTAFSPETTIENARVSILLGKDATNVQLDDVLLTEKKTTGNELKFSYTDFQGKSIQQIIAEIIARFSNGRIIAAPNPPAPNPPAPNPPEPNPPAPNPPAPNPPAPNPPAPNPPAPNPVDQSGKIMMPIEVIGPVGHIESVKINLGNNGNAAQKLWLQVHNVSYDGKGRIRVNNGSWINLTNNNNAINMERNSKAYGGFGGGFNVIEFDVNANFTNGDNTIEFEYSKREGPTAGYRVIGLNVLNGQNQRLIAASSFAEDDPKNWRAPLDSSADYNEGKRLWDSAKIDGTNATCEGCHAQGGVDLKYFNVSNKVIIRHSIMRGFNEKQGEQIASYIRKQDIRVPDGARIWNPPYQPGPGLDSKPAYAWSAGAGIDAVLKSDGEMLPYMFNDTSMAGLLEATNVDGRMNLRNIPLAIQLPDWLRWLPPEHPSDFLSDAEWNNGGDKPQNVFNALDTFLTNGNPGGMRYQELQNRHNNFASSMVKLLRGNGPENSFRGAAWSKNTGTSGMRVRNVGGKRYSIERQKYILSKWGAVKFWDLMQRHELEGIRQPGNPEKYQWPTTRFTVFQIAAHFIGDGTNFSSNFSWESKLVGTYNSSAWYQLQMLLTPGNKNGGSVEPLDWSYNFQHVNLLGKLSNIPEPLRLFQNLIKGYQDRNRPGRPTWDVWTMREVSPWRIYSDFRGDDFTHKALDSYENGLRAKVTSAMLNQFLKKSNRYNVSDWSRTTDCTTVPGSSCNIMSPNFASRNWFHLEDSRHVPYANPNNDKYNHNNLFVYSGSFDANEADAMFRLLPRFEQIGMRCQEINGLARWSAQFWPRGNWEQYFCSGD